jgi:hypothetical protein
MSKKTYSMSWPHSLRQSEQWGTSEMARKRWATWKQLEPVRAWRTAAAVSMRERSRQFTPESQRSARVWASRLSASAGPGVCVLWWAHEVARGARREGGDHRPGPGATTAVRTRADLRAIGGVRRDQGVPPLSAGRDT